MGVMYSIRKFKTRNNIQAFVADYNEDKPLGERLRSAHVSLLEHLVELYYLQLRKHQVLMPLQEGEALPLLRTNNVQLSQRMNCSERTILNLRRRLLAADVIGMETWHGSNSSYELAISAQLLHLGIPGHPDNLMARFAPDSSSSAENFAPYSNQLPLQVTSKLIQYSGEDFQLSVDNQGVSASGSVENHQNPVENAPLDVENPQLNCGKGTKAGYTTAKHAPDTPPQVAAHPPAAAPDSLAEALRVLPQDRARTIRRQIELVWISVLTHLSDEWSFLTEAEEEKGKARLAEYLIPASPRMYAEFATQLSERIVLVAKWLARGRKKEQNRWIPIPSVYFDHRNPNGFAKTKGWYKTHKEAQWDIQNRVLVTKATRSYLNSLKSDSKTSPVETYRKISQYLGKRDQRLLAIFHENIMEYEQSAAAAA